jgi:hypothetical protein
MAQRELQVTALQPAARAMDTYVRPEFESNAAAISKLTTSIQKTNDARAMQQAELDSVAEDLAFGMDDVHEMREGHSQNKVYKAKLFELRGANFASEAQPHVYSAYEEFKLSAKEDGSDLAGFLHDQFAPLLAELNGSGGQFLLAGASQTLQETKNKIIAEHQPFLDNRAHQETVVSMSLAVDRIVHQAPVYAGQGQHATVSVEQRISNLDNLAVEFEQTTPIKKGEGNKLIFDSLMSMANAADPETSEMYLHMARLVRYAKGKDGDVRPEAWEAISKQSLLNDSRQSGLDAIALSQAAAAKLKKKADMQGEIIEALGSDNADQVLTPEFIAKANESEIGPEKLSAIVTAYHKLTDTESPEQLETFNAMMADMDNNRYNPDAVFSSSTLLDALGAGQIHGSRIKEMRLNIQSHEKAGPILNNGVVTKPRNDFIKGLVAQNEAGEYDVEALQRMEEYKSMYDASITEQVRAHYLIGEDHEGPPPSMPTTTQMQIMAQNAKAALTEQLGAVIQQNADDVIGKAELQTSLDEELSKSENRADDKGMTIGRMNPIGISGISSVFGYLDAETIEDDMKDSLRAVALYNPAQVFTRETSLGDTDAIGLTYAEQIDRVYGNGAFARWYKVYGPPSQKVSTKMYQQYKLNGGQ